MIKQISIITVALAAGVAIAQQYPMLDNVANKVVQKYQGMSCEQLWASASSIVIPRCAPSS